MSTSTRDEARYLSLDERELVGRTHLPAVQALSVEELAHTRKLVRELRDRARDIAHRQRRQMRGKAEPTAARAAADDTGSRRKLTVLSGATKRLSAESRRRGERAGKSARAANARAE